MAEYATNAASRAFCPSQGADEACALQRAAAAAAAAAGNDQWEHPENGDEAKHPPVPEELDVDVLARDARPECGEISGARTRVAPTRAVQASRGGARTSAVRAGKAGFSGLRRSGEA